MPSLIAHSSTSEPPRRPKSDEHEAGSSIAQQKLFAAVEDSPIVDVKLLRQLLDEGADPYFSADFGALVLTPLQRAISLGHNGWIDAYAELGLSLDAKSRLGGDAATASVIYKNTEALDALARHGAHLKDSRCNGGGLLHLAVYHKCEAIVQKLYGFGHDLDARSFVDGSRPVHEAACSVEMMRLLFELGANLNSVDDRMQTAGHLAADPVDGCPKVLMWLMTNGANLLMVNEDGKTAAGLAMANPELAGAVRSHLAAREARIALECIEMASNGNSPPPIVMPRFAGEGALQKFKNIVYWGTTDDVDGVIVEFGLEALLLGPNPISFAASKGNCNMIHHLLGRGFSIDALGDRGVTPLADSIAYEEYGAMVALLDAGANVHTKSETGKSAFEIAQEQGKGTAQTIILSALARRAAASAVDHLSEELGVRPRM